eukprot:gene4684-5850_t
MSGTSSKRVLGLPDVDVSQPDSFETPDVAEPPSISNDESTELVNENIERTNLAMNKAYQKFSNRKFTNKNEDFSDKIYKKKLLQPERFPIKDRTIFDILPNEPEKPLNETPLQKFQRLQYEITSFRQEMQSLSENGTELEDNIKPIELTHQLADLQNQLTLLLNNDKLKPILDDSKQVQLYSQLRSNSTKSLVDEINSFTDSTTQTQPTEKSTTSQPSSQITYELFYSGDQAKFQQLQRATDLDKRLAKIESLIGNKETNLPISQSIVEIREKLSLLDPTKIDTIQQKMSGAMKQLETLKIQDESVTKSLTTNEKKINEIFDIMNRWENVEHQLPSIINRLYSLRYLHEEGISFSNHLINLEKEQSDLTSLLKSNSSLMNKMDESFKSNLLIIKGNIESIEKRMSELSTKLETNK